MKHALVIISLLVAAWARTGDPPLCYDAPTASRWLPRPMATFCGTTSVTMAMPPSRKRDNVHGAVELRQWAVPYHQRVRW